MRIHAVARQREKRRLGPAAEAQFNDRDRAVFQHFFFSAKATPIHARYFLSGWDVFLGVDFQGVKQMGLDFDETLTILLGTSWTPAGCDESGSKLRALQTLTRGSVAPSELDAPI